MAQKEEKSVVQRAGGFFKKQENSIWALIMAAALFVPIALRFDFYYDLNDDVLIKDVLSGVYSGSPDGHTMQLLYPLGVILALLYRAFSVPVFGIFLVLCQFGSIWVIGYKTASCLDRHRDKVFALAAEGLFFAAAFGAHLVFIQYTVTAGMLSCAAIFWVMTSDRPKERTAAQGPAAKAESALQTVVSFLKKNLPALALYWLAFCLRSEMALLLLPLAGAAGLCKWGQESRFFARENVSKYLLTFGVLAAGLAVCLGLDSLGYRADGWPAFRQFFEDRTESYDYQLDFINDYEANADSYEAIGVPKAQQQLLQTYNFGVDDTIDAAFMKKIRQAAVKRPQAGGMFKLSAAEGLWSLRYRHWLGSMDFPLNFVMIVCMVFALMPCVKKGRRYLLWQVPLCLAAGGVLWLFLLLRNRPVDRVFDPLYLAQITVFAGLLLGQPVAETKKQAAALSVLVLAVSLAVVPKTFLDVEQQYAEREETNRVNEAVMAYCSVHSSTLFLEDVYSTVQFSEKIGVDRDKPFNYDLLGGWLVKSPLTKEKLGAFGFSSMGEAVQGGKNVCLLTTTEEGIGWLTDYFEERQLDVTVLKTGTIADSVEIYQVVPDDTGETWN